jgi:hypothetical protein
MHAVTEGVGTKLSIVRSRRTALRAGGALLAGRGGLALPRFAAAQSTPEAGTEIGLLLVQCFSHGSLFATQGSAGVLPYTLILWDAADRGFFFTSPQDHVAGFVPTNSLLIAIKAGERPKAAVVVPAADGSGTQHAWALQLAYGDLGSDPGAVTYQGTPIDEAEAADWLGVAPTPLAHDVQDVTNGFLVIAGPPSLDMPEGENVRIDLG